MLSTLGFVSAFQSGPSDGIPGIAVFSDDEVLLGSSSKGITAVCPGGFNFLGPQIANFSVVTGGAVSMQSGL